MTTDEYSYEPSPIFRYELSNALYAYLKEHPEQRQGQGVMNLLRDPESGSIPSGAQVWNLKDDDIHERIKAALEEEGHEW